MREPISRRQALRLGALSLGSLLLAATGCATTAPTQTATVATAAPASASGNAAAPPPAAPSATTIPPTVTAPTATVPPPNPTATQAAPSATTQPPSATATNAPPPTSTPAATVALATGMALAASRYLDALSSGQRDKGTFAFTDAERQRWHWTTPSGFPRHGLPLKEMKADQRTLALALLRASSSEMGYQKALDIVSLQKDLGFDPELYYVSIFGNPGSKPWGWRFEGHHLSRQFTIAGAAVGVTPLFLGSWPSVTNAGLRALGREEDAARALITSLTGPLRSQAMIQNNTLTGHVSGNLAKVSPPAPTGISYGQINADQQKLVMEIIRAYLGVQPDSSAAPMFERIQRAGWDQVRFGWAGNLEPRKPHYYRLQGPTFLLEFDNSRNSGTHVHSVWRDFEQDYAYNAL
ncbi:MAG: DUF3500 domain-containing protein [Chloroflexi bacterium]|nr:DUF3500 domain-containing protein [Chloroflexota bacterium]